MTATIHHPLARKTSYAADPDGMVRVNRLDLWGRFDDGGRWLEGEVRFADPQMCRFLHSCWLLEAATQQTGELND